MCAFGDLASVWRQLTGSSEDGPVLRFLERGDQLSSMLSGLLGIAGLAIAITQVRRARSSGSGRTVTGERVRDAVQSFVDRKPERARLRRALRDGRSRVIIVAGETGVGKTKLVRRVLDEMNIEADWRHASPSFQPSIGTVLRAVETAGGWTSAPELRDQSSLDQLEAAVRHLGTRRAIIVFDSAEWLLNDNRQLMDLSLEEGLEALATGPRHGVKLVLVTEVTPLARADGTWVDPRNVVPVSGLPLDYFKEFTRDSADGHAKGLASLTDQTLANAYVDLGGRPRLAQLFDAIIAHSDVDASALAAKVRTWADQYNDVGRVGDRLLRELTAAFRSDRLRVYNAVAAFGTPVDAALVARLVNEGRTPEERLTQSDVARKLRALSPHAIYALEDKDHYYLPAREARRVLTWSSEDDSGKRKRLLLRTAAKLLRQRRTEHPGLDGPDPQASLAEVDAWLHAGIPHSAFRSIRELDGGVLAGNPNTLYRRPREDLAERLDDADHDRIDNYNVLGYLYHVDGDFERSQAAYRKVLELAGDEASIKAKVYLNLAWLSWSQGYVEHARRDFERARDLAPTDRIVVAGALEGVARCQRRQGRFRAAIETMKKAADMARPQRARWGPIAVRMVRLYVDAGQFDAARVWLTRIEEAVDREPDSRSNAAYLDALAAFHLGRGEEKRAVSRARQAVQVALRANDPVTALEARTTICIARLRGAQWNAAAREAGLAERYRGMEQSMIVIALHGIACRRSGQTTEARQAFGELLREATARAERDRQDFTAWELLGLARCALYLDGSDQEIEHAVIAFKKARHPLRESAPTLTELVTFLVKTLATDATEQARLRPVLVLLERALLMPSPG
ncbi:hypothetical protein C6W10_27965 [Plantactinospora sp. BB1]|nr:hypothetical protein C6W10_27965 [Plantactinospora sp. BB1]